MKALPYMDATVWRKEEVSLSVRTKRDRLKALLYEAEREQDRPGTGRDSVSESRSTTM